jgi:hypothetical protein
MRPEFSRAADYCLSAKIGAKKREIRVEIT